MIVTGVPSGNVAASCSQCNNHKSGNVVEYRIELVRRIGEERVQALENSYRLASHNIEYLKRMYYFAKRIAKVVSEEELQYMRKEEPEPTEEEPVSV